MCLYLVVERGKKRKEVNLKSLGKVENNKYSKKKKSITNFTSSVT